MSADNALARLPTTAATSWNAAYVEQMYAVYQSEPETLSQSWRLFFEGFELGLATPGTPGAAGDTAKAPVTAARDDAQVRAALLIFNYRAQGHLMAHLNPLGEKPPVHPDLTPEAFGFSEKDLDAEFDVANLSGLPQRASLRDILGALRQTYCGHIGVEYMHIQDRAVRRWLQAEMEGSRNTPRYTPEKRLAILESLTHAELFETFLHTRYPGQKRFSLEGGETLIPAMHELVQLAAELGVKDIVIGMAHRGRLNVLTNLLHFPYAKIFNEFEGRVPPGSVYGDGDVKYHKGFDATVPTRSGEKVNLALTANPSHLEAVNPVVEGRARAKQRRNKDTQTRRSVLPLLIHGDAALAGQGVVPETLNLSQLEGYRTGGTVHIVINNQIGFTTLPEEGRSTTYCTDVAKMIEAPIFHVNGDDPEALVYATELALRFRHEFGRDVFIDQVCYRKHGHNEGDEPEFTQPKMYKGIKAHPSPRQTYIDTLVKGGIITPSRETEIAGQFNSDLQRIFEQVKGGSEELLQTTMGSEYEGGRPKYTFEPSKTGVSHEVLIEVAKGLNTVPDGFKLNPKVGRYLPAKLKAVEDKGTVDWSYAEALATGSLLAEGNPVRISGQDCRRGTFSQRHAVWRDMETNDAYTPANHIREPKADGTPQQAKFCVYNSSLSEAAVLGFDYGYSLDEPDMLVMWEAQFGDFSNGAQTIIDQFIVSSESKWYRTSGIVLLLPHGFEGQGPEHSNAYLERYLAGYAEENIQVANMTTPANYFHILRRQLRRNFRRPLVIMTPKSMLRHPRAVSPVEDLISGHFREIIPDDSVKTARRVVLSAGKVYYDLLEAREKSPDFADVALVRVEQIAPLNTDLLKATVEKYGPQAEIVWCQEEPKNRGAWSFMFPHFYELFPGRRVRYAGRQASASPATGMLARHKLEQQQIVEDALR